MHPRHEELQDEYEPLEESPLWWNLLGIGFLVAGLITAFGLALITLSGGIALFRWAIS